MPALIKSSTPALLWKTKPSNKKALLIGIRYIDSKTQKLLDLPHRDVLQLRQFLIDVYKYSEKNITMLLDKPGETQPTYQNIRQEAARLVANAASGDHFFFFYAGHSVQVPELSTEEHTELDGLNEVMVPSDGNTKNPALTRKSCLVDNQLKHLLINPLPEGSTFMAVLDTCHSESLLNLDHDECNRGWSCIRNKSSAGGQMLSFQDANRGRSSSPSNKPSARPTVSRKPELAPQHPACARVKRKGIKTPPGGYDFPNRCQSPLADPCHMPLVACLSACKDDQLSCENPEDKNGGSFTERLLNILRKDSNPRLEDLMKNINISIHGMLLDAEAVKQLKKSQDPKEVNRCQDPQLSSETPVNMEAYLGTL
ncbi:peptidase C14, caspase domain-containing protein [Mycena galericulata]|nr:peptidase C14, caspase domain-containing protein [Mycena galericulata]